MSIGWVSSAARNARAEPWKLPRTVVGTPMRGERVVDRLRRLRQRHAFRQVERDRRGDELRMVIDGERRLGRQIPREHRQRDLRAALRAHVHLVERVGRLPVFRRGFHHDVVLVARRIDRRDGALRERVVERGVDQPRRHAEARRGVAIDHQRRREPLVLLVGVDVDELGQLRERLADARLPGRELGQVVRLDRVLVRGVALPAADADVLHGREEEIGAGLARELPPQPGDDPLGAVLALGQRLQRDEHRSSVALLPAGEADYVGDTRIRAHDRDEIGELLPHGLERDALVGLDAAYELPRVLLREEALRNDHVQIDVERHGRGRISTVIGP